MKSQAYLSNRVQPVLLLIVLLLPLSLLPAGTRGDVRVSKLGQYSGYSQPKYDGWARVSEYITVRDGTKLAADIFRPSQSGVVGSEPMPVIWTFDRYHRADLRDGRLITQLDESPWLRTLLRYGYAIGVVDVRGGGASFGIRRGELTQQEARDGYDVTEWFAAQPWCNQRIGMFGRSYLGISQYTTASTAPPHLVAIFPEMAMFDLYSLVYPGGVFRKDFVSEWSNMLKDLDTRRPAAPVDKDNEGVLVAEALKLHQANTSVFEHALALNFRDSREAKTNVKPYIDYSPSSYLSGIKKARVATYHLAGWYDMWPKDALLWFKNLDGPQKIVIGPWSHTQSGGLDLVAEHLRWYDYWLKGIDNGVMNEPPIHYYTIGAPEGKQWRSAWQWPLANQVATNFYFESGRSGSANSINDGLLSTDAPAGSEMKDDYTVNYTTTSGKASRWTNGYGGNFNYRAMTANDDKGLTYTSPPLEKDVEVTGHAIVHLFVSSSAKDADLFAYLEEVDDQGNSQYLTEGTLRASHRALSTPPYENMGLPYHRSFMQDVVAMPADKPVEVVLDLLPASNIFDKGHRIRLTITGADVDNTQTPELAPPPSISIHRDSAHASYITLPIIPASTEEAAEDVALTDSTESGSSSRLLLYLLFASVAFVAAMSALFFRLIKKPV